MTSIKEEEPVRVYVLYEYILIRMALVHLWREMSYKNVKQYRNLIQSLPVPSLFLKQC